jgi:hypothetical protein
MTDLERCARAIQRFEIKYIYGFPAGVWDNELLTFAETWHSTKTHVEDQERKLAHHQARAVLETLKTPSEGMIHAAHMAGPERFGSPDGTTEAEWTAMIQHILLEGK